MLPPRRRQPAAAIILADAGLRDQFAWLCELQIQTWGRLPPATILGTQFHPANSTKTAHISGPLPFVVNRRQDPLEISRGTQGQGYAVLPIA